MLRLLRPALVYALSVLAAGFLLGVLRVLVLAPLVGPVAAVALELPVILGLSWLVAGRVLRDWPLPPRARLSMGGLAFAVLIAGEAGLALALGQRPAAFLAALASPDGALGLAGQVAFALIPRWR